MKFMNLTEEFSNQESKYAILPISYEKDLTYGQGASKGPLEILKASEHLEYYDEQFDNEPFEKGILTLPVLELNNREPGEAINEIKKTVSEQKNKFILSLGGDHAVTIGCIQGQEELNEDFDVIFLDAHTDLFYSWNNSQYNHRCVAHKASENHNILSIGIRSMDKDEADLIKEKENIGIIKAYDYNKELLKKQLNKLKKNIYISLDVDVFDPSFIRNTGTPEPGGLFWNQVIEILQEIFKEKQVIGADIVEFAPNTHFNAEAFSLARLTYKIMAINENNKL